MKFLLFFLLLLPAATTTTSATSSRLTVKLAGLGSTEGSVRVCLMNEAGQFLKNCYRGRVYDFRQDRGLELVFEDLPAGDYAVMAFHDENGDGKLSRDGLFGLPSEPYAFSNNPSTFFGPPAHHKCVFRVDGDKELKLKF